MKALKKTLVDSYSHECVRLKFRFYNKHLDCMFRNVYLVKLNGGFLGKKEMKRNQVQSR